MITTNGIIILVFCAIVLVVSVLGALALVRRGHAQRQQVEKAREHPVVN